MLITPPQRRYAPLEEAPFQEGTLILQEAPLQDTTVPEATPLTPLTPAITGNPVSSTWWTYPHQQQMYHFYTTTKQLCLLDACYTQSLGLGTVDSPKFKSMILCVWVFCSGPARFVSWQATD